MEQKIHIKGINHQFSMSKVLWPCFVQLLPANPAYNEERILLKCLCCDWIWTLVEYTLARYRGSLVKFEQYNNNNSIIQFHLCNTPKDDISMWFGTTY